MFFFFFWGGGYSWFCFLPILRPVGFYKYQIKILCTQRLRLLCKTKWLNCVKYHIVENPFVSRVQYIYTHTPGDHCSRFPSVVYTVHVLFIRKFVLLYFDLKIEREGKKHRACPESPWKMTQTKTSMHRRSLRLRDGEVKPCCDWWSRPMAKSREVWTTHDGQSERSALDPSRSRYSPDCEWLRFLFYTDHHLNLLLPSRLYVFQFNLGFNYHAHSHT